LGHVRSKSASTLLVDQIEFSRSRVASILPPEVCDVSDEVCGCRVGIVLRTEDIAASAELRRR
jgi:hypothetical protein